MPPTGLWTASWRPTHLVPSISRKALSTQEHLTAYIHHSSSTSLNAAAPYPNSRSNYFSPVIRSHDVLLLHRRKRCGCGLKLSRSVWTKFRPKTLLPTKRKLKRRRLSPSVELVAALRSTGDEHALPYDGERLRRDLSYNHPAKHTRKAAWHTKEGLVSQRLTLQSILGRYINCTTRSYNGAIPDEDEAVPLHVYSESAYFLSEEELTYIRQRGYGLEDVIEWAFILRAKDISSTLFHQDFETESGRSPGTPLFLLGFLLRRNYLSPRALHAVLVQIWQTLLSSQAGALERQTGDERRHLLVQHEDIITVLVIRLLRHARMVWPPAIPNIVALISEFINVSPSESCVPSVVRQFKVAFTYNRILRLLALPCSLHPVSSSLTQAKAQFSLIARMAEMEPPLTIFREGYKAIVRVQLACEKTAQEQEWASLKARSWPPWKKSRTNIDEEKGPEYGVSRAGNVLQQMQQAGYSSGLWGKVANVYAGWDTDKSPTIQTRTSDVRPTPWRLSSRIALWAARISATRTLNEAWACFLTYSDAGYPPDNVVYFAMCQKIVGEKKRLAQERKIPACRIFRPKFAGDGLEVLPESTEPSEVTYVRTPAPTFEGFVEMMLQRGLEPQGKLLVTLVRNAESLRLGVKILAAGLSQEQFTALFNPSDPALSNALRSMPKDMIAAFMSFLNRTGRRWRTDERHELKQYPGFRFLSDTLSHCMALVLQLRPMYPPIWNELFTMQTRSMNAGYSPNLLDSRPSNYLQSLHLRQQVKASHNQMSKIGLELDYEGFKSICLSVERAAIAARRILNATAVDREMPAAESPAYQAHTFLQSQNADGLRDTFHTLVGTHSALDSLPLPLKVTIPPIPRLLTVPSPAELHHYIRALGFMGDHKGIIEVAEWIVKFKEELEGPVDNAQGGNRRMRRTLTAIRAFLEGRVELEGSPVLFVVNREMVERVRDAVDEVEEWGGWPSEWEVETYIERAQDGRL